PECAGRATACLSRETEWGFCSWLVGYNDFLGVHVAKDLVGAAPEQLLCSLSAERNRVVARSGLTQHFAAVRPSGHRGQIELVGTLLGQSADRHLATAAQATQERALTLDSKARVRVVEGLHDRTR